RCLGDFQTQVIGWNPQMENIILDGDNGTAYAAAGGDLVPGFELTHHGLPTFLARLLRPYRHKIRCPQQDGEKEKHRRSTAAPRSLEQIEIEHALNHLGCCNSRVYTHLHEADFLLDCHR